MFPASSVATIAMTTRGEVVIALASSDTLHPYQLASLVRAGEILFAILTSASAQGRAAKMRLLVKPPFLFSVKLAAQISKRRKRAL